MAGKELDEGTRAAERAEMRIRLQARIARLLEVRARTRAALRGGGQRAAGDRPPPAADEAAKREPAVLNQKHKGVPDAH